MTSSDTFLNNDEFEKATRQMVTIASLLASMPTQKMLNSIAHAETVGSIADPTGYRKVSHTLNATKRMAELVQEFGIRFERIVNGQV